MERGPPPVRTTSTLVLGLLILGAPAVLEGTDPPTPLGRADQVLGVLIVGLAAVGLSVAGGRPRVLATFEGANALLGLATLLAPIALASTTPLRVANVLLGALLVLVAGWDAASGLARHLHGPGRTKGAA